MTSSQYKAGQRIRASYYTGVYKPIIGGWRSEWVNATLEVISPGKAKVISCEMDQADSKRQRYNITGNIAKQIGTVKLIVKLHGVEIIEDVVE